ncbi:MAG: GNAT family N-acetyltransferase [Solobacterium sp.]|nr:GNAT family N-acetyltransferase [Solobacterium sp.]
MNNILESKRLYIRPFVFEDAKGIFKSWQSKKEAFQYLDSLPFEWLDESKVYIIERLPHYAKPFFFDWVIERKEDGALLGEINAAYSKRQHSVEIGYILNPEETRKGYMFEALQTVFSYFKTVPEIEIIYGKCVKENLASKRLMEKLGMQFLEEKDGLETYQLHLQ